MGRKVYYENKNVNPPAGFTLDEQHSWRARMVGATSIHIDPETWQRLCNDATEAIRQRRKDLIGKAVSR